jgi:hypothetical protein
MQSRDNYTVTAIFPSLMTRSEQSTNINVKSDLRWVDDRENESNRGLGSKEIGFTL